MAFKAILDLAGTEYKVEECSYNLYQATNQKENKPTAFVTPSPIALRLQVDTGERIKDLWEWGFQHDNKRSGSIKFYKIDEDASIYELSFEDAFCTGFNYHMSSHGSSDMSVSIEISARKLELEGQGFDFEW